MGEVGQRLVDGFPRGAHKLRDLLLGQVVGDPHRPTLLSAEALRQLQQLLRDPAGDVGENQVGQVVVGPAQPACQHPQQLLGDLRAVGDPGAQRVAVHRHRSDLGDGGRTRRARPGIEDRQLAEHVRRPHHGQQVLPAIGGPATDLHLAGDDDVEPVSRLTFGEDRVAAREVHRL